MAGRGRGLTLPAWMTQDDASLPSEQKVDAAHSVPSPATAVNKESPQFSDAPPAAPVSASMPHSALPTSSPVPANGAPASLPMQPHPTPQPLSQPPTSFPPSYAPSHPSPSNVPYASYPPPNMPFNNYPPPHYPPYLQQTPNTSSLLPQAPPQIIPYGYPPQSSAYSAPYVPPPAVAPKPINPENDASAWTTHNVNNTTYYYNSITKTSTFDKPNCLKTPEERSMPTCSWKQYTTDNGKVYYSNGKDSMWTMPAEYQEWLEKCEAIKQQKAAAASSSADSATTTSKPAPAPKPVPKPVPNLTPEQAVEAFNTLLANRNISSTMKFKEIADVCSSDEHWGVIRTNGERKQLISEYQNRKLKAEREEQKLQQKKYRTAYMILLAESPDIDSSSSFDAICDSLSNDIRYKQLEERERREYFHDFISELQKKEKLELQEKKTAASNVFKSHVLSALENGEVAITSLYADVKDKFRDVAAKVPILDDYDMRRVYQDAVAEIEAKQREAARQAEAELLAKRDSLIVSMKNYLNSLIDANALTLDSHWRDIQPLCLEQPWYEELLATYTVRGGNANKLRDIFDDVYYGFRDEHKRVLRNVKDALYDTHFTITHTTTFEEFTTHLTPLAEKYHLEMTSRMIKLVYRTLHEDAVLDYEEEQKQITKYKSRYIELLEDYYYLSDHVDVTWEEAKKELSDHSAYRKLEKEFRKQYFEEYMTSLREKLAVKQRNVATMLHDIEAGEIADAGGNGTTSGSPSAALPAKRSLDYSSDSSSSSRGRKHSKKHKKKHKKHKKSRSRSRRSRS